MGSHGGRDSPSLRDWEKPADNDHMFAMPVTATKGKAGKQATAAAKKPAKAKPQENATKMSGLDAAARVLAEAGKSMNCRDRRSNLPLVARVIP
jgi:hypothetical protein